MNFCGAVQLLGKDRIGRVFSPPGEFVVFRHGRPLLGQAFADRGVNQHHLAFFGHRRAAGKAMLFAQIFGRRQRDRHVFPMNEVLALEMAPVHVAPIVPIGIVLIEKVVGALVRNRPVRVVVPQSRRLKMIDGTVGILFNSRLGSENRSVRLVHHLPMDLIGFSIRTG